MKKAKRLYLREVPTGFPKDPKAFDKKCLLMSIIVAFGTELSLNTEAGEANELSAAKVRLLDAIKNWYGPPSTDSLTKMTNAGKAFKEEISEIKQRFPDITDWCDVDNVCSTLSDHYHVQLNIIDSHAPRRIAARYPAVFVPERPQLHLLREYMDSRGSHITVISNIKSFWFNHRAYQCPACLKRYSSPYVRHWCRSKHRPCCRFCYRPRLKPNHYWPKKAHAMHQLCDPKEDWSDSDEETMKCPACNVKSKGLTCFSKHRCNG